MISDYLFKDMETGENFFVETDSKENAIEIANQYFDNARCIMRLDVEDAERWGLDTYQCPFFYANICSCAAGRLCKKYAKTFFKKGLTKQILCSIIYIEKERR